MQFVFSKFGLFSNNKSLLDAIDKNDVKNVILQPPYIFIWQENDSILFVKSDGSIQRLDQTTSSTKFVLFEKKHGVLIRCDSEKKLTINLVRNDQILAAQYKIPLMNVIFNEKDVLYAFHHPTDFVLFIGVKGRKNIYKIRYNILSLNEDLSDGVGNDSFGFKIILEETEEINLKQSIIQAENIGDLLVFLVNSSNEKSTYCIYDMKLTTIQFIPFYHNNQNIILHKRNNDLVIIENSGDVYILNGDFALPFPIKVATHFLLPKGIPFITFLMNDIIITITSIKIECFSIPNERIIYESNEIPTLDIKECIPFSNESIYGIYQSKSRQFYQIIPTNTRLVVPFMFDKLIESTNTSLGVTISQLNSIPRAVIQNRIDVYNDASIFIYLPRDLNFVMQSINRLKKEETTYSFSSQSLLSSLLSLVSSIKIGIEGEPTYQKVPYISFNPVHLSLQANTDLHCGLFEEFGNCIRKQFINDPFALLLFIQELKNNGFDREQGMRVISSMYTTIQCVGKYELFQREQLHVVAVIELILFGVESLLKAIEEKSGIFPFYSVDYERMVNVVDVICEKKVFGYDDVWKKRTYEKIIIHLLIHKKEELVVKLLNRIDRKDDLIEDIMIIVVLDKINNVDISFLTKLLSSH